MSYFRKYLISIRKFDNEGLFLNLQVLLFVLAIAGIGIGLLFDLVFSPNYFLNMLKGLVSIVSGLFLFSALHLYTSKRTDRIKDNDSHYNPIRARFSYKQRLNFSIAVATIGVVIVLLGSVDSPTYTLKSILLITLFLSLLAFTRRMRDEFIKDIHEIHDIRDLGSEADRLRKQKLKKEKEMEKKIKRK